MKTIKKSVFSILVLTLILMLAACGGNDNNNDNGKNNNNADNGNNAEVQEDDSHGWGESQSGAIVSGKFDISEDGVVTSTEGEGWHQIYKDETDAEDYTFSADIKWLETGSVEEFPKYGLIASFDGLTDYSAVFIDKNHNVLATFATVDGSDQEWVNGDLPEDFDHDEAHELKVQKIGNEFTYFVDGEEILTRTFELGAGEIGIITEDTIAEFSNFKVE